MINEVQHKLFVSIVIPTWNRKELLMACLSSLQRLDYPRSRMEIVVWDNGSEDGTREAVRSYYESIREENWADLRLREAETNLGPYLPYNEIYQQLHRESTVILGLDDDVEMGRDCVRMLVHVLRDRAAGIVGARSVFFSNPDRTASRPGFVNPWLGQFYDKEVHTLTECDYVIGCCWLFKKEILEHVGEFDPDYFTMHWEIDFCTRAKQKGYKVYYQPEAIAKHKIPLQGKRSGLYYLYRNKMMYIRKNVSWLPRMTSYLLYTFLWFPKILLSSIIFHKKVKNEEIKLIVWGVYHGIIGKTGRWEMKKSS